jgi:hypothetical protein
MRFTIIKVSFTIGKALSVMCLFMLFLFIFGFSFSTIAFKRNEYHYKY